MRKERIWRTMLTALAVLTLSACGASPDAGSGGDTRTVTIQELLDASRTADLLDRYGSVLVESAYAPGVDAVGAVTTVYMDADLCFEQSDEYHAVYADGGAYLFLDGFFGAVLAEDPPDLSGFDHVALDPGPTALETVTSVEEDGDTLVVRSRMAPEDLAALYEAAGADPIDGDYTTETYVLAADDLRLLSDASSLWHADGSGGEIGTVTVTYGAERPENAQILYEHLTAPDRRTVTVVLDPGTEEERALTATAQRGDQVFPYLPEGHYDLYLDPDCTEAYTGGADPQSDLTLYSPREADPWDLILDEP